MVVNSLVILGIVLGILAAVLLVVYRSHMRDLYSVFLVLGVGALAVAVTIIRVDQYRSDRAAREAAAANDQATATAEMAPSAPVRPPIELPTYGPMIKPPTGGAAPPAVQSPYARRPS